MARKRIVNKVQQPTIEELFKLFVSSQIANGVSEKTAKTYRSHMSCISKHLDIHLPADQLTNSIINDAVISMRNSGLAHNSISSYMRVFSTFSKWCASEGFIEPLKIPKYKDVETVTVQGRCITKDADLLTSDAYPISADELNKLIDIYSGNYTMLSLVQKYADSNNMNVYITPVEKKLETYEKFYTSCLNMIAQIVRNHGVFDEQWANNPFCLQLYDVIGTGAELSDFKMLRLEVQTPIKDYPNPTEQAHFDFHFKPVNRNNAVNFS